MDKRDATSVEQGKAGGRAAGRAERDSFQIISPVSASDVRGLLIHGKTARGRQRTRMPAGGMWVREIGAGSSYVVLSAPKAKAARFKRLLGRVVEEVNSVGLDAVWQALERVELPSTMTDSAPQEPWRDTEAARWAEIRAAWLKQHPALTAAEIAKIAGSSTVNPSALLNGWIEAKRAFGVTQGRTRLYPAFQIGPDGQPKEQFRRVLMAFEGKLDGWPLAIWLTKPNTELEGWATPLDVIERDPEAVAAAARIEAQSTSY
jgi:hypothetical protein